MFPRNKDQKILEILLKFKILQPIFFFIYCIFYKNDIHNRKLVQAFGYTSLHGLHVRQKNSL